MHAHRPSTLPRRHPLALMALAAALAWPMAGSAADDTRANREREALRRAQAALQQAQQQRDALQAEKATREQARDEALAQAAAQRKALGSAQAEARQLREELAQLRTQLASQRDQADEARRQATAAAEAAAQREQELKQQLATARQQSDDRREANATLTALLAERTRALADAQRRSQALHALGLDTVERFRAKGTVDQALQADPVLGLTRVRVESTAESLRMRFDALLSEPLPPAEGQVSRVDGSAAPRAQ
ncbi:hypothetical protein AACH10_07250 [Ideonella sp. DXS22W]|uniref:Metalloendopeptidase n=1 Tax=Pseudaquabacterium inlustre TaxID=2984192 RepID=A0ABU9CE87_9BURK